MRYDTPVYMQNVTNGEYDPKTGNYGEEQVKETLLLASVMDTKAELLTLVYGGIRQGSLMVQVQNHSDKEVDRIRIGEKLYRIDYERRLRTKQTFVVSEVQA